MPYILYVCLQDEDKIVTFTMDAATGQLTPQAGVPVGGTVRAGAQPGPARVVCRAARTARHCESRSTPPPAGSRPRGRSRRPTRPRFWPPTAQAGFCSRRITKAGQQRSIPSVRTAR